MTDERPLFMTEPRDDAEFRFRALGGVVLSARAACRGCTIEDCPACLLLADRVPLPDTVVAPGLEPREDLEAGLLAIAQRIEAVGDLTGAEDCPGWARIDHFRTRSNEIAAEEDE